MTEGIEAYAATVRPGKRHSAAQWFADHPDAAEQVRRGRELDLSWSQILRYLKAEHGYPFDSTDTVIRGLPR